MPEKVKRGAQRDNYGSPKDQKIVEDIFRFFPTLFSRFEKKILIEYH
jgi:hypothetical protein